MNEIDVYNRLISRRDAWAKQTTVPDKSNKYQYLCQKSELTDEIIKKSLTESDVTIGSYTTKPVENISNLGVLDIDNHDGKMDVRREVGRIVELMQTMGLHPFVEGSSGGIDNGAHICVIFENTPAKAARECLTAIMKAATDVVHEVFPKQDEISEDGYGNLVKLPWQFNNRTKTRSQILDPVTFEPMERQQAIEYLMNLPVSNADKWVKKETAKESIPDHSATKGAIDILLQNPKIKPCIVKAYNGKWVTHGIGGGEGHTFRLAAATELLSWNASDAQLHEYYAIQSDYDQKKTQEQINHARKKKYTPTGCKKIAEECTTLLKGMCATCNYYKKPKERKAKKASIDGDYHLSDLGNAQRLVNLSEENLRFCAEYDKWVVWDGKVWGDNKYGRLEKYARNVVRSIYDEAKNEDDHNKKASILMFALRTESAGAKSGMLEWAKTEDGVPILPEDFDTHPWLFNVQNGTIDLRTGKLQPHDKYDFITKISPVAYDPDAKCPTWHKFLDKIFAGNQNIIEYMQRKAGYSMTGDTSEEDVDELYGNGGNGKSKYTGEIIYIMGDYHQKIAVETIQAMKTVQSGGAPSPDVACLKGARLVTVSEPDKGTQLNEKRVKDWTGRDPIRAREMYKPPFTFMPEFKLWIYTNFKIRIKGQDKAIWRRMKLVPFTVTISEEEKDTKMPEKLLAESAGILNWMIEGCLEWQKDGLKVPTEILEATEEYKEDQDYLGDFFKDCCEVGKNHKVLFGWLYDTYRAYCEIMDMPAQTHISFAGTLEERGIHKIKNTNKGKIYGGIRLKPEIEEQSLRMKTQSGGGESDGVTVMTVFLRNLLDSYTRDGFSEKTITTVTTVTLPSTDSENQAKEKVTGDGTAACGICGQPLNGDKVFGLVGLGDVHFECNRIRIIQYETNRMLNIYKTSNPTDFHYLAVLMQAECEKRNIKIDTVEAEAVLRKAFDNRQDYTVEKEVDTTCTAYRGAELRAAIIAARNEYKIYTPTQTFMDWILKHPSLKSFTEEQLKEELLNLKL